MLELSAEWVGKRHLGDNISHDRANYSATGDKDNWDCGTAPIKQFELNGCGPYDVTSNVYKWCLDCYDTNYYQ